MNHRLQQLLAAENISQSQFADTLGVARASVSHILAGRNKPGFDFIESIARNYPDINLEWVVTGKGKMYKTAAPKAEKAIEADDLFSNFDEEQIPINNPNIQSDNDLGESKSTPKPVQTKAADAVSTPAPKQAGTPLSDSANIKSNTLINSIQSFNNQRNISKIIIFYDDNTYQELK